MDTHRIIHSDGHVQERDTDIRPHLEEPDRNRRGSLLPNDEWDSSMYGTLGMRVASGDQAARYGQRNHRYLRALSQPALFI